MYYITKKLKSLPIGHRLLGHNGECRFIHGHNLFIEITVKARILDKFGFVIDFAVLKEFEQLLEDKYDHCLLLWRDDPLFKLLSNLPTQPSSEANKELEEATGKLVNVPAIPTVENIASWWLSEAQKWLEEVDCSGWNLGTCHRREVKIHSLTVWETENCKATAYADQ